MVLAGDPRFGAGVRGTTVVVLDVGRTMGATEESGGRRIDHATAEVRRWVERTTITGEVAVVRAGMRAVLNFAPVQIQVPADVTLKTVNMAMELEGLSFALTNRDR